MSKPSKSERKEDRIQSLERELANQKEKMPNCNSKNNKAERRTVTKVS